MSYPRPKRPCPKCGIGEVVWASQCRRCYVKTPRVRKYHAAYTKRPDVRQKQNEARMQRYHSDPEYRRVLLDRMAARRRHLKEHRSERFDAILDAMLEKWKEDEKEALAVGPR